jgi:sugar/nucleoside kinase (ribokinase family)
MPDHAPRIAGAGLLALDVIISEPSCPEALTFAGGTCGNVLSILSFLRWTATPIGFIGDDLAGKRVLADLATAGVHSVHIIQQAECSTPVFIQRLERDGNGRPSHSFANTTKCPHCGHPLAGTEPSAKVGATPIRKFTTPEHIDVFFMDRLSEDILSLAESAHARGALVFYEPSAKEDIPFWQKDAFDLIDIVKYSADRFTTDEFAPFMTRRSRRALWEVQTNGARGLRYRKHGMQSTGTVRWRTSAAIPANRVVDTCGAGDWCSAGLLHGLLTFQERGDSASFANAVRFGQLLAAWACAFVGARGAMYCNDRQATWSAIKSLVESRQMDLSRLPFATQSRPSTLSDMSSCVAHLRET